MADFVLIASGNRQESPSAQSLPARRRSTSVDHSAESCAEAGRGYERPRPRSTVDTRASATPLESVAAYVVAMAALLEHAVKAKSLITPEELQTQRRRS
jgi:hypothetical protein